MGKWQKCDGAVCWTGGEIQVTLKLAESERQQQGGKEQPKQVELRLQTTTDICLKDLCRRHGVEIADVIVPEWRELWVQVEPKAQSAWFSEEEASEKPNGWWAFTFRNYLGKSVIRIQFADGRIVTTDPIEVVSPKTPLDEEHDLFYPKFLRALIDDLIRYLVSMPFDWGAPTEFPTEERVQPPSPIFVLHVLAQNAQRICHALQTIWRNPHRRLVTEERWVLLSEASSVDADTILMMLQHPEHLRPYRGGSLSTLAQRLKSKVSEQTFVPERVFERRVTETLDTPENRFIKRFMDIVLYWCDELQRLNYWQKAQSHQPELQTLREFVRFLRADPLFADVGELEIFPASSQVLLRRDGYRECLQVYRLLHIARAPIFDRLQDAIDNRRIDQIYEFWCFFRLAEELAKILGNRQQPLFSALESDEGGLRHGLSANLGNGYQLFYNRTFSHGKGSGRSYSVSLRPDFSLMKGGQPLVVFDAKFRFDEKDIQPSQPLEEEMDDAQQEGNIERLAKHADICKMHTYRDALKCRAAVVLFPGKEGDGIFYDKNEGKLECCVTLRALARHIIKGKSWKGVGALPLVPESKP
ncbi:MAG: hypothetical protein OXFUSZZB_000150 [Candidatus Fervidibacter sp.]|jgi:predicted component of viral defense system (DUF524 family)